MSEPFSASERIGASVRDECRMTCVPVVQVLLPTQRIFFGLHLRKHTDERTEFSCSFALGMFGDPRERKTNDMCHTALMECVVEKEPNGFLEPFLAI